MSVLGIFERSAPLARVDINFTSISPFLAFFRLFS